MIRWNAILTTPNNCIEKNTLMQVFLTPFYKSDYRVVLILFISWISHMQGQFQGASFSPLKNFQNSQKMWENWLFKPEWTILVFKASMIYIIHWNDLGWGFESKLVGFTAKTDSVASEKCADWDQKMGHFQVCLDEHAKWNAAVHILSSTIQVGLDEKYWNSVPLELFVFVSNCFLAVNTYLLILLWSMKFSNWR